MNNMCKITEIRPPGEHCLKASKFKRRSLNFVLTALRVTEGDTGGKTSEKALLGDKIHEDPRIQDEKEEISGLKKGKKSGTDKRAPLSRMVLTLKLHFGKNMKANAMNHCKAGIREISEKDDPFYFHGIYLTFTVDQQSSKSL